MLDEWHHLYFVVLMLVPGLPMWLRQIIFLVGLDDVGQHSWQWISGDLTFYSPLKRCYAIFIWPLGNRLLPSVFR